MITSPGPCRVFSGETVWLELLLENLGQPGGGLTFACHGSAWDRGVIEPARVSVDRLAETNASLAAQLLHHSGGLASGAIASPDELHPLIVEQADGGAVLAGHFPTFEIEGDAEDLRVVVEVTGREPGHGILRLDIWPHQRPDQGWAGVIVPFEVVAAATGPVRRATGRDAGLHALDQQTTLFALVGLGPGPAAVAGAQRTMEVWLAELESAAIPPWTLERFPFAPELPPTIGRSMAPARELELAAHGGLVVAAPAALSEPALAWLADEDLDEDELSALQADAGGGTHGAAWERRMVGERGAAELALWLHTPGLSEAAVVAAQRRLRALVTDLVTTACGPGEASASQAVIGRWGWVPEHPWAATPYEWVCGVDAREALEEDVHAGEHVRAVTEWMWLGSALLAKLGDSQPLAAVAETRPAGDGLVVALRSGRSLGELEVALGPILPG